MTIRKWDFFAYFCVGISFGSLTGYIVDHPVPVIVLAFIIAFSMAKQP